MNKVIENGLPFEGAAAKIRYKLPRRAFNEMVAGGETIEIWVAFSHERRL